MKLLIISDAPILSNSDKREAYAPYVKEMDIWMQHARDVSFVCPTKYGRKLLTQAFQRQDFKVQSLRRLEFHSALSAVISFLTIPYQAIVLWNSMRKADHIHLRCPGNLALLASMIQVTLPRKRKTVKYAGNWDPASKQPLAYKMQKWILSNTALTKNMQVLVYGEWKSQAKNIKSFFTASYYNNEKEPIIKRDFKHPLKAMYVGTMGVNKRPFETVALIKSLRSSGLDITLEMYGDGPAVEDIKWYRKENGLLDQIVIRGNQPGHVVKEAYKNADLLILLSKSEGWPKVVAEAMFWGVVPIVSSVSCVPWMIANGERGILVNNPEDIDIEYLRNQLTNKEALAQMSKDAAEWSRQYTMDTFAQEVKKLLQ
ncbi:glycosyl transferase family 1 [Dokdonia sp. Dokd-P16]|uniref:glycosyltransferase family 4 protein n=1 Tax=Dokdonia sp. Dokd-P16 TaxID=2173169 RepID=UPI000D54750F|nr:glycosyltransferase [Dokdonia sp. Dokd-P16]AWH72864.1 glycosyl transferase family 1 [Dokdonia sp. Dokd-P16]